MEELERLFEIKYPVEVHWVDEDDGDGYYYAFLPDFGQCACSATGDTRDEALEELDLVRRDVIQHYVETGKSIPEC